MFKSLGEFAAITTAVLSLGACATTAPPEVECEGQPRVVTSTREFIRIRHRDEDTRMVNEMAHEWCQAQSASAEKTNTACSGCCVTAYQCR